MDAWEETERYEFESTLGTVSSTPAGVNWTALNMTDALEHIKLVKRYVTNRSVEGPMFYILICAYALLIVLGTLGNCLAITAVIRKASMRTPRNMFIINLAVSDLLLCVITMPFTLMEVLTTYWPLGNNWFLCKLTGSLQAISIFVSTISITAIALDRYHVIVYPTQASVQRAGAFVALSLIWTLSCVLAAPLFIWRTLVHKQLNVAGVLEIDFCYEDWPTAHGRAYYSIFSILVQYAVPIIVVSVAYARICKKLRHRMKPGGTTLESSCLNNERRNTNASRDQSRVRRTNALLISIALIFGISWLPLNVFNVLMDLMGGYGDDHQQEKIIYAFCHMAGMSSACSNPIIYGYLNDNFKREYKEIWAACMASSSCLRKNSGSNGGIGPQLSRNKTDAEQTAIHFKKSVSPEDGDIEQSTLITQVLDRQK